MSKADRLYRKALFNLEMAKSYSDQYSKKNWFKKAVAYLMEASEAGSVEAKYSLGLCYETGEGVEKDKEEAIHWYTDAHEAGHPKASQRLGWLYYGDHDSLPLVSLEMLRRTDSKINSERNPGWEKSYRCFDDSKSELSAEEQYLSGFLELHCYGVLVPEVIKKFDYAAAASIPEAAYACAMCISCFSSQAKGFKEEERTYIESAVNSGLVAARFQFAELLASTGRPEDTKRAIPLFEEAYRAGDIFAAAWLGILALEEGNIERARPFLLEASRRGHHGSGELLARRLLADDYNEADRFFYAEQALSWVKNDQACSNEVKALYGISLMGQKKDDSTAAEYLLPAANEGDALACEWLGVHYMRKKEPAKALPYFLFAADNGRNKTSSFYASEAYFEIGDDASRKSGMIFLEKAAHAGNQIAQYNYGRCYEMGDNVDKDSTRKKYWYEQAARQGYSKAEHALGLIAASEGRQKEAFDLFQQSAGHGRVEARIDFAWCYENGFGTARDLDQALHQYALAAQTESPYAMVQYAFRLLPGSICQQPEVAFDLFRRANSLIENSESLYGIGLCYKNGYGVDKDSVCAFDHFQKAIEKGEHSAAMYELGLCYLNGESVDKDEQKAKELIRRAANQGSAAAKEWLNANDDVMQKLNQMIGLSRVKETMGDLVATLKLEEERAKQGITPKQASMRNMLFLGNPGTGKTTVAKVVYEIMFSKGVVSGPFVSPSRSELIGEYQGHTTAKTEAVIKSAKHGVLFIDEAYGLVTGGSDSFGKEFVTTLVQSVGDKNLDVLFILAGYKKEMNQFLETNGGLSRRFPLVFDFDDYTTDELMQIFEAKMAQNSNTFDNALAELVQKRFEEARKKPHFGNGGYVDNLIGDLERQHAALYDAANPESLMHYTAADMPESAKKRNHRAAGDRVEADGLRVNNDALQKLNQMIGLSRVKKTVSELVNSLIIEEARAKQELPPMQDSMRNMQFLGNPGTGKTTVAEVVYEVLLSKGVVSGPLITVTRADLVADYQGQTGSKTRAAIESASHGVLFIDEAYSLVTGPTDTFGLECVSTLVAAIGKEEYDVLYFLAGYEKEMNQFLETNSGLARRFPLVFNFDDYTTDELMQIFESKMAKNCNTFDTDLEELVRKRFEEARKKPHFGNGGYVDNLISALDRQHAARYDATNPESLTHYTAADMPKTDCREEQEPEPES